MEIAVVGSPAFTLASSSLGCQAFTIQTARNCTPRFAPYSTTSPLVSWWSTRRDGHAARTTRSIVGVRLPTVLGIVRRKTPPCQTPFARPLESICGSDVPTQKQEEEK